MVENLHNATALTPSGGTLPAELLDEMAADAGRGVSTKAEDQLIPLIYILQTNSPVCDKRDPAYRDGASPGCFFLRGAIDPIREGDTGIVTIPCEMQRVWLEFLPGRQGLVDRHAQKPADVKATVQEEGGRRKTNPRARQRQHDPRHARVRRLGRWPTPHPPMLGHEAELRSRVAELVPAIQASNDRQGDGEL